MRWPVAFAMAAFVTAAPAFAAAQPPLPKVFAAVGAIGQVSRNDFTSTVTFPLYLEQARITGPIDVSRGLRLDGSGGLRLARHMGVGATVSFFRGSGPIEATYSLPYPFLFDEPRTGTGRTTAHRTNLDVHVQALVPLFTLKSWRVVLEGGPSYTRLSQDLPADVLAYSYAYPFDEVKVAAADNGNTVGHGFGGHAGATFARHFTRHLDLFGAIRWSSTKATLKPKNADNTLKVETGGAQVGGGLRFIL